MAAFYPISQQEMEAFLFGLEFQKIELDGVRELVYAKRMDDDGLKLSLRVFTGINPDGASREVGKDAIRVCLFWKRPDGQIVKAATDKRVHRVEGWKKNLTARIEAVKVEGRCIKCDSPMIQRKSKFGSKKFFLGCTNYPNCKHTEAIA